MRRIAHAPQRPVSERTASLRATLIIKRSAICCELRAGLHTLRSVRFRKGPHRFEPRLAFKRSAICCEQCAGLQTLRSVRFQSAPDRIADCLRSAGSLPKRIGSLRAMLSIKRSAICCKKCNPGHCLQHNFCGSFQFTLERHEEWSTDDVVQEKKKRII